MPQQRLVEGEFAMAAMSETQVIISQLREHLAIPLGIRDAFDDYVEPIVEREPRRTDRVHHRRLLTA